MSTCKDCVFYKNNEICDFGIGKIKKPPIPNELKNNIIMACPFSLRKSYYDRNDKETQKQLIKARSDKASKYFI